MSLSRSSRLSRKRKNDDSQPESSQFDITVDDFQEDGPVFRLPPKRAKQDKVPDARKRTKKGDTDIEITKNNVSKGGNSRQKKNNEDISEGKKTSFLKEEKYESQSKETGNRVEELDDDLLFKKPNSTNRWHKKSKHPSNKDSDSISQNDTGRNDKNVVISDQFINADKEKDKELLELEKSICTSYEKLCHCCKHIVPSSVYTDHLKECMQKFKHNTRATRSTANTREIAEQENKTVNEIENEVEKRKEQSEAKKCQICSKVFKYPSERIGHVKGCAMKHGITIEELSNQGKGKNLNTENLNKSNKTKKSRSKKPSGSELVKDPDLAIALALSRSLAEDEADKRSHEEEKLLALGLDDIVQEDRSKRPIVVLKPPPDKPQKAEKYSKRKKKAIRSETVLMQRSTSDRERIISEKVAMLLAVDNNPLPTWDPHQNYISKHCLAAFQDKSCSLWDSSHCPSDEPLDKFYVQELVTHIKPQKIEVGGLFKRLSQIPGRLNATASIEDSDSDDGYQELDVECSVAEAYRTQLILAELMGSQEGLDCTVDGIDERVETNLSQTEQSGFLFMQNKGNKNESVTNNNRIDMLPEHRKIREEIKDICNNNGAEIEVHDNKDAPSLPQSKELNLNEIECNDSNGNKTVQMNEGSEKIHLFHNQKESNINKLNKDPSLSPVKSSFTVPVINQETEIITLDDDEDDDDNDDMNPTFKYDMSKSTKENSPNTGWITRSKENKSKSPLANSRNMSSLKSPKSSDTSFTQKSKTKSTDTVIKDTSDLDFTNLVQEAVEKNTIQISDSADKLHSDIELDMNKDQVSNKNKFNTESAEITPKRDVLIKKKPLNKKLLSTFNQVSKDDNESTVEVKGGKQISPEVENEIIDIDNLLANNQTKRKGDSIINNQKENTFDDLSSDKSRSSFSLSGSKIDNDYTDKNCISTHKSREKMKEELISDWGSLLESGDEADTQIITREGKVLRCHSLVFFVRCKQLFTELKIINVTSISIKSIEWKEIPFNVAYKFIEYIYTGKCENLTKADSMWAPLINLGRKYRSYGLVDFLESLDDSIQKRDKKSGRYTNNLVNENLDKDDTHKIDSINHSCNRSISHNSPTQSFTPRNSLLSISNSNKNVTAIDGSQSPDLFDEDDVEEKLFDSCEEIEEYSNNKPECRALALEKTLPFKSFTKESEDCEETKPNELSKNLKSLDYSINDNDNEFQSPKFSKKDLSLQKLSSPDSEEIMEIEKSPRRKSPLPKERDNNNMISNQEPHSVVENQMDSDVIDLTLGSEAECSNSSIGSPQRVPTNQGSDILNKDCSAKEIQISVEYNNLDRNNARHNASSTHRSPISVEHSDTEVSKPTNLNVSSVKKAHTLSFQDTSGDVDFFDEDTEDMDPLVLGGDTTNSDADDTVLVEKNQENVRENLLKNKSHEVNDIFCTDDAVDNENDNSFIDNVWDDFDDMGMGCEMAAAYVTSPAKAQDIQEDKINSEEYKKKETEANSNVSSDVVEVNTEESYILRLNDDEDDNDEMSTNVKSLSDFHKNHIKASRDCNSNKEENSFRLPEMDDYLVSDGTANLSGKSSVSDSTLLKAVDDAENCDWNCDMTLAEETGDLRSHTNLEKGGNNRKQKNIKDKLKSPIAPRKKPIQITPRPDYKNMMTPELKKELTKYGIRPISKNKAVQLLTHVYEQTHPVVTDSEAETSYCETPPAKPMPSEQPKKGGKKNDDNVLRKKVLTKMQQSSSSSSQTAVQKKRSNIIQNPNKSSSLQKNLEEEKDEVHNLSQDSDSSDGADIGCAEETILLPERNDEENQDELLTFTQQGDLQSQVSEFIRHDTDLRMKVLLYEPIWIRELQTNLKLNGIKCSMAVLMNILDQQCVTFRSENVQKQGKGRTRRKPK